MQVEAVKDQLAARLRALIKRQGLTQSDLARLLGENREWVSVRARGKHALSGPDVVRIAAALGVSPCAFFEEVKPEPQVVELSDRSVERITVELAHVVAPATAKAVVRALQRQPEAHQPSSHDDAMRDVLRVLESLPEDKQEQFEEAWREQRRARRRESTQEETVG